MEKARILFVVGSLGIGGTEKQLYLLLKYLDRKHFKPLVVHLSDEGYWIKKIEALGIEVVCFKRKGSFDFGRLRNLVGIMTTWKPDIVHAFQPSGNTYAGLGALLSRSGPTILSYRSFLTFKLFPHSFKGFIDRFVYLRAGVVVCNSRALQNHLIGRFGKEIRTAVIHNGIDSLDLLSRNTEPPLRNPFDVPQNAGIIGTVGRLVPIKNHMLFLDIAKDVLKIRPDTYFVLVGDGPMRGDLHAHARHLGISNRVIFTGERPDANSLMDFFDIFLLTTSNGKKLGEGFPNVVMEAMARRIPCIASDAGGTRELFKNGVAGYLVNPSSKAAYTTKILELLNNQDVKRAMGEHGRNIIRRGYSIEKMAGEFEALYNVFLKKTECYKGRKDDEMLHTRCFGLS